MLVQARKVTLQSNLSAFKKNERSAAACTTVLDGNYEYAVTIDSLCEDPTFEEECKVIGNLLEQTTSCSCGQFERI